LTNTSIFEELYAHALKSTPDNVKLDPAPVEEATSKTSYFLDSFSDDIVTDPFEEDIIDIFSPDIR